MTRAELDGYINALARMHGKKPPASGASRSTRTVKSRRQKRTRRK